MPTAPQDDPAYDLEQGLGVPPGCPPEAADRSIGGALISVVGRVPPEKHAAVGRLLAYLNSAADPSAHDHAARLVGCLAQGDPFGAGVAASELKRALGPAERKRSEVT